MKDIDEKFEDFAQLTKKSSLVLDADKSLNFQVSYPIVWTGYLNNEKIKILQTEKHARILTSFEFEVFPEVLERHKETVINIIDKCLKRKGA